METLPPPLSGQPYHQLVYTLTGLLPPPVDDTPQALYARNHAAVVKVAALLPVNANETDLAAQCIAARAQAEELLRLIRQNADDIELVMRLNAQYGSMVRTSLSVHARLTRVQALRQKRQAIEGTANEDAWAQHIAERSMLNVVDANTGPQKEAEAPVAAPAPRKHQTIEENVSKPNTDSHDAAFETRMSEHSFARAPETPDAASLRKSLREAMAGLQSVGQGSATTGRESRRAASPG